MRDSRVFVIAEAGVNHNGSVDMALELVDAAAAAGADAVKFQTFRADRLVSTTAAKADYQVETTGEGGTQLDMLRLLELTPEAHERIVERCQDRGIAFMSTAFDVESLHFLARFDMPAVKIPSGDVTAAPLVLEASRLGRPLIMSTGMCTLDDIEEALGVIAYGLTSESGEPGKAAFAAAFRSPEARARLYENVVLLHCVTDYPAAPVDVNLRAMDVMRERFGLRVGYSDHTLGTSVALAAVARGACVLEKHFTASRDLPGPDHRASLEPQELAELVKNVREIEVALGEARKEPAASELRNRTAARRSLVAARAIERGELFSSQNLAVKRPGDGTPPMAYWDVLGRAAKRAYAADEGIDP